MNTEFYRDNDEQWRWRLTADNGEIIGASTEGYRHYEDCLDNYRDVTTAELPFVLVALVLVVGVALGAGFSSLLFSLS